MKPDNHLSENALQIEVSDDQKHRTFQLNSNVRPQASYSIKAIAISQIFKLENEVADDCFKHSSNIPKAGGPIRGF
ncbi:hypothetical protein PSCICL_12960 [Pseudomonas cichorii]|nr:hypothetical protein PSCICL_12960 [Pseudomonas cichorii]